MYNTGKGGDDITCMIGDDGDTVCCFAILIEADGLFCTDCALQVITTGNGQGGDDLCFTDIMQHFY